jgi:hypothetical protein
LFSFEALYKAPYRFLTRLGGDTWKFGVDIHRNRKLEKFPLFLEGE